MLQNDHQKYGLVARFFHWTVALLILCLLSVGFWMESLEYSPFKGTLYGLHKSFGMIVLVLAALRIVWRGTAPQPGHLATHAAWEISLARVIHFLLYTGMILMPLSGWVMSAAGQHAVPFFWLFNVPPIVPAHENLAAIAAGVHALTAYTLIAAIGLHYMGALKHHVMDRDETLRRMGGNLFIALAGAVLIAGPVLIVGKLALEERPARQDISAPAAASAQDIADPLETAMPAGAAPLWTIDKTASRVGFEFSQYGQGVTGAFGAFDGVIRFDPENPGQSAADIRIKSASITTGDQGRDEQARGPEWFDSARFPVIHFVSQSFAKGEGNGYIASGSLTIRDVTRKITFPFTLDIVDGKASMRADINLSRLDYGVGQGPWAAVDAIGGDVKITISLAATRE